MQHPNRIVSVTSWTALFLALFLMPGLASALIPKKPDQKCINNINKGASKVSKAQAGDNNACTKDYGKDKIDSAADCVTSDPKGKVAKAISKIKTGDCGGNAPPDLPGLDIDSASIGATMTGKDLDLLEDLFGSDLDGALVVSDKAVEGSKEASKCQAAVLKAAGKCQDAKLSSFNSCKKDGMKAGTVTGADSLEAECMTPTIPDLKGKIAKKCLPGDFDLAKKCSGLDLDALFPGLNPPVDAAAIDAVIECRVCVALNALDGLFRNCDQFDNGVEDGSCDTAFDAICDLSEDRFCVGGTNDGLECIDASFHSDCPPGPLDPNDPSRCIQDTHFFIETVNGTLFSLTVGGQLTLDCDNTDPNTGLATCVCNLVNPKEFNIPSIGFICLETVAGCKSGFIDCGGGTSVDTDTIGRHDVALEAALLDPNQFNPTNDPNVFFGCGALDPTCLGTDPNCTAHEVCAAMCTTYCDSLGGDFEYFDSACEGFCEFGSSANFKCLDDSTCTGGLCVGANPPGHPGQCQCSCLEIAGPAAGPGGMECEIGIGVNLESASPCDGTDITTEIGAQCVPITTGDATAVLFEANAQQVKTIFGPLRTGSAISCAALQAGSLSGLVFAGNQTFFDSDQGDLISPEVYVCE